MIRDTVAHLRPRGSVSSSTPSTSSTATASTRTTRSRSCARPPRRVPTSSCCATPTAACCRTGSARSSPRSPAAPAPGSASTATTTPPARSPTRLAAVEAGATHVQGTPTATASAPATPTCSASSPTWRPSSASRCCPRAARASSSGSATPSPRSPTSPPTPPALRRGERLRPQGRPARVRDQGRPGPLPAHGPGAWSATTCACWSPRWPAGRRIELKGKELGMDLSTTEARRASSTGSRSWSPTATPSRPPMRRFELLLRDELEGERPSSSSSSPGGSSSSAAPTARWSARPR